MREGYQLQVDELAEAKAELAEARAVLALVEWAGTEQDREGNRASVCPCCGGSPGEERDFFEGHTGECRLDQTLRKSGGRSETAGDAQRHTGWPA
jgi:hypothetical protein